MLRWSISDISEICVGPPGHQKEILESSVARELAENLISPRPQGSRGQVRPSKIPSSKIETSAIAPTAIAFTKRLASPPPPPPRSRLALTAREGAYRVERSAPLGLGPTGQGARELAREQPCCHFLCWTRPPRSGLGILPWSTSGAPSSCFKTSAL